MFLFIFQCSPVWKLSKPPLHNTMGGEGGVIPFFPSAFPRGLSFRSRYAGTCSRTEHGALLSGTAGVSITQCLPQGHGAIQLESQIPTSEDKPGAIAAVIDQQMHFHGEGRWLTWFWKPMCGRNAFSANPPSGFLCLFSSYWVFWTKDQNAAVGQWLWEDAPSFLVGFVSQGMPDVVQSRYPGIKTARVLLVLPPLPGCQRQALFLWWCLTRSASDSRAVQDAFGMSWPWKLCKNSKQQNQQAQVHNANSVLQFHLDKLLLWVPNKNRCWLVSKLVSNPDNRSSYF